MNRYIRIAFLVWLMAGFSLSFQSCVYDDDLDYADDEKENAVLILNVEAVGPSRSTPTLSSVEQMHTARILIFDEDYHLEKKRYAHLDNGVNEYAFLAIPLSVGRKHIYIIANEESVDYKDAGGNTVNLSTYLNGIQESNETVRTDIKDFLENCVFVPDYTKNIPMSSSYDVEIQKGNNKKTFYVVRAATKFDVSITNNRSEDIRLKSFTINKLADKSYLYPRFSPKADGGPAGIITINEGKRPFVFDDNTVLHWAEWLAKASDESQTYPDAPKADNRGWIMEYSLPESAVHDSKTMAVGDGAGKITANGGTHTLSTKYFPESKVLLPDSKDPFHEHARGLEQQYSISLEMESLDATGKTIPGSGRTFEKELPNLRALFRNTHVSIEIKISDMEVKWLIYVRPWNVRRQPEIIM